MQVKSIDKYFPAIASAGSVIAPVFYTPSAAEVLGGKLTMGAGTLTSGWSLNIYKNASHANSRIGTTGVQGATTAYTATDLGTYLTTTVALKKLAAGNTVLCELVIADADTVTGTVLQLDYLYGYED